LYHSENNQKFPSRWGPLSYLHPEQDQRLVTENYLVRLNNDLELTDYTKVEMLELHEPIWTFVGLEDARLVQWDNDYYLVGVRRDTKTNGEGRMEYTKIHLNKDTWTVRETNRLRIPAPDPDASYCEKNWYPINDKPYHFVKWTSPVEIVKANPIQAECEQVVLKDSMNVGIDMRGGSHMVRWGNHYISLNHETTLFFNYLNQKDGIYRHRLCVWDDEFNLIGISPEPMSFLDARIEFAAGAAVFGDDLLVSFGFQDNAAFVLKIPGKVVNDMITEAIDNATH
jgi:predicted GH43/DUF377 family glycosyl hydrolase